MPKYSQDAGVVIHRISGTRVYTLQCSVVFHVRKPYEFTWVLDNIENPRIHIVFLMMFIVFELPCNSIFIGFRLSQGYLLSMRIETVVFSKACRTLVPRPSESNGTKLLRYAPAHENRCNTRSHCLSQASGRSLHSLVFRFLMISGRKRVYCIKRCCFRIL